MARFESVVGPRSRWWSARRSAGGIVRVRAPTSVTRPSESCRITTRLASHATRREVSYETRSGHLFDEDDVVAEAFQTVDVVTPRALGVATLEVVGAEVMVRDAVLEHVPEGDQHRVLDGDDGLLRAAPGFEPVVEDAVVALLRVDRRPGRFLQRGS